MTSTVVEITRASPGPDNGGPYNFGQIAASPNGSYRAVTRNLAGTSDIVVWYSNDNGLTWSHTSSLSVGANHSVAIWDDGTIHLAATLGTAVSYYRYSAGSWSAASAIINVHIATSSRLFTDGTNLIDFVDFGSNTAAMVSTNGGTTWVGHGAGPLSAADGVFVGGMLLMLDSNGTHISRFNYGTLTWDVVATSLGTTSGPNYARILAGNSTSTLYVVVVHGGATSHVDIAKSTDSGATWSTLCTAEVLPAGLGNMTSTLSGAVYFGSDNLFHFYSVASGNFVVCTRDLAASGTYGSTATAAALPSGTAINSPSPAVRAQRYDGVAPNTDEIYVLLSVSSNGDVVVLTGSPAFSGWVLGHIRVG